MKKKDKSNSALSKEEQEIKSDKITLFWLRRHVPVKFWISLGGLLLGAFILGFRFGLIPDFAKLVGPIIGVDVINPRQYFTPILPQENLKLLRNLQIQGTEDKGSLQNLILHKRDSKILLEKEMSS